MRNNSIDLLRFIGLAMIIFAHIGSPEILFQIRNFDVPLMVLVSGMAFGLSYKPNDSYLSYLWKRSKRLVLPVWIFLTLYFCFLYIFTPQDPALSLYKIGTSYLLISGIGYVWIIRVFILVALVSPFIFNWHSNEKSDKQFFATLFVVFMVYEACRYFSLPYIQEGTGKAISYITHYIIAYPIIFAIGLRLPSLKTQQVAYLAGAVLFLLICSGSLIYATTDTVAPTQAYKYPPSTYYFSYAILISTLLWLFRNQLEGFFERIKLKSFALFCAQNSIWIYLWHIPLVRAIEAHFLLKYIIVFGVAVIAAYIQVSLVKKSMENMQSVQLKRNIKALLTG